MNVTIRPMGDSALLAEVETLAEVLALHAALAAARPAGVVDLVPAARTVLVRVDPARLSLASARSWIERTTPEGAGFRADSGPDVVLDVVYDGTDLAETAEMLGLTADALVDQHARAAWRVAFTGFAPGFGYLVSPAWTHDVPRLAAPRTRVPAGSIGLAGGFSGAYPRETPGGWRLIGRTDAALFDPDAAPSVLLPPGTRVRFRGVRAVASLQAPAPVPVPVPELVEAPEGRARIRILDPGLSCTIQDLGRPGRAALGIARSGALDRSALKTANRLVGNPEAAAGVEVAMGGLRAVAMRDVWFAVTGATGPLTLDGRPVDPDVAHPWPPGAELRLDWFAHGARAYLAVRGGIDAPASAGSRSTDTLAGIGPAALAAGDELALGEPGETPIPVTDLAPWGAPPDELELSLAPGARADWFTARAQAALFDEVWTVSAQADRVGIRLDGPELTRVRTEELPSEGMVPGALQVPPSGRPTILLADGPVTGGYPVVAVVAETSLDLLGQARPGTRIRFRHARP